MRGHALEAVEQLAPEPDRTSRRVAHAFDVVLGDATPTGRS
jgi:hypothetical protein